MSATSTDEAYIKTIACGGRVLDGASFETLHVPTYVGPHAKAELTGTLVARSDHEREFQQAVLRGEPVVATCVDSDYRCISQMRDVYDMTYGFEAEVDKAVRFNFTVLYDEFRPVVMRDKR